MESGTKTFRITLSAVFIALIAVCTQISVPMVIPFTMQTFAIFLALLMLGGEDGCITVAVYILIGAAGMPVFSKFSGGVGMLLGPTGGFIFGFFLMAALYLAATKVFGNSLRVKVLSLTAGLLLCYTSGTLWFMHYASASTIKAISLCVLPFILPDLLKLALAVLISTRAEKMLMRTKR